MNKIILYSKPSCPKCKILKQKLDNANIQYEENQNIQEMKEIGLTVLPVLNINNEIIPYANAVKWIDKYLLERGIEQNVG